MCQDCREANLKRKREQFEAPREDKLLHQRTAYPSKSKKVWRDRFEAARKNLKRDIEWYQWGLKRGCVDSWFYRRIERSSWVAQKYRKARADVKAHGSL